MPLCAHQVGLTRTDICVFPLSQGCGVDHATVVGATPLFGMKFSSAESSDDEDDEDDESSAGGGGGVKKRVKKNKLTKKSPCACCGAKPETLDQ